MLTNKLCSRQPNLDSHMVTLDGLRGMAIFLVLLFHAGTVRTTVWFDFIFFQIGQAGWCGVDLFFVLSGFLITNILIKSKHSPNYLRGFYMRRFLRIFPLYYGFLVAFFFLIPWVVSLSDNQDYQLLYSQQGWYWAYLHNWLRALNGYLPNMRYLVHFWTLAIEEQFYLLWPLMVLLISQRRLMTICLFIIAAAPAIRVAMLLKGVGGLAVFELTLTRIDTLALGAAIALSAHAENGIVALAKWVRPTLFACIVVLIVITFYHGKLSPWGLLTQSIGYTIIAILFSAVLVAAITFPKKSLIVRFFNFRILRFLGKYSYGIYVFHWPITIIFAQKIFKPGDMQTVMGSELFGTSMFFLGVCSMSTLVAFLSWHLYEKQFLKLKRFFPR